MPIIGRWPREVHRLIASASGGRSRHGIVAHPAQLDSVEVLEVDGLLVTTLARTVVDLATHLSDSPGESASRVNIHLGGFPAPRLQTTYFDEQGKIGDADFDWEELDHLGESDGKGKYLKEEYLAGREPGDVVFEEKIREDRLRALGKKVTRWDWPIAIDVRKLAARLTAAGLRRRRRR